MAALTKKYRLFWVTETKEILNNYDDDYFGSITLYPNDGPNTYFDSDTYQDIINKINVEGLKKMVHVAPPSPYLPPSQNNKPPIPNNRPPMN